MHPAQRREAFFTALESGQYTQAQQRLHRLERGKHTFCAIGVGMDTLVKTIPQRFEWRDEVASSTGQEIGLFDKCLGVSIPSYVMPMVESVEMLGIDYDDACKVSEMNDDHFGFKDIAAYLRAKYPN